MKFPNVASRSFVGTNPKQLQMSILIEPERRQFLWYFLYLCWDRSNIVIINIFREDRFAMRQHAAARVKVASCTFMRVDSIQEIAV